ncbi:hypothetical protein [Streptomyces lichenis]|uniref:DUF3592 domain-containing protein n=1 Tax=Streptomyces lichenis TaxID=2306967 RepID=A0ABT0IG75_9ACTN|nr:hypothetical protein [Streptomyces lichenis]MCK8680319.1 hypothetical protein [Streptomyces lichenis]
MTVMLWVAVVWVVAPLPFMAWFGVYPLWLRRRLGRVGVEAVGECRSVATSEDRRSTSFVFTTAVGEKVYYRSRLSWRSWGTPGREAVLVYDPGFPRRFVRSKSELTARPEALTILWGMLGLEVLMLLGFVAVVMYEAGVIH